MSLTKITYNMIEGAIFSVTDYGAVGNDSGNQQPTMQAAIDACAAAGGGIVYLPAGTYRITSSLLIPYGVSMRGEGASVSIISAYSCNALTFNSGSYDSGSMFYEDFCMQGAPGGQPNFAAVESNIPAGGTFGTDSRDGLYFRRLKIHDFTIGFYLAATWEWQVTQCKIYRVNQPFYCGGYNMVGRITDNNMVFEGGSNNGSLIAANYGVNLVGPVVEGLMIRGNQIFGFERCVNVGNAVYTIIDDNDMFGTVYGVAISTANSELQIKHNYFEISADNAIGIYHAPLNSETASMINIEGNNFITGGGRTGTKGIVGAYDAGTYAWNMRIVGNIFTAMADNDILIWNAGNIFIQNNRFMSTGPSSNINLPGTINQPCYVLNNRCVKGISGDSTAIANGKLIIFNNVVSDAQAFGAVWASSGKLNGVTIGDSSPAAGGFTALTHSNKAGTANAASYTLASGTEVIDYVLPTTSMFMLYVHFQWNDNTSYGPGAYLIQRQGTQTRITNVVNDSNLTITVDANYKVNIAIGSSYNGIPHANLVRVI